MCGTGSRRNSTGTGACTALSVGFCVSVYILLIGSVTCRTPLRPARFFPKIFDPNGYLSVKA
jgi:hypothetical protein